MLTYEKKHPVLIVRSHQEEPALAPLVLAFANDPTVRWMYPEAHQFRTFFPRFARAFGGQAFIHSTAQHIDEFHGTALWLPPGVAADDHLMMPLIEETVAARLLPDVRNLLGEMGAQHPTEPHWYLTLIGIDPRRQGAGLGAILMARMLAAIDRRGEPAYLEASNPRNISFYERLGFEVQAEIQVGSSPTIFGMLRAARTRNNVDAWTS